MENSEAEQIRLLAEKISESDRQAFDRLFRLMYPRLVRFAFGYTQSRAIAGDIVQDVFVILWEKRHEVDSQRSLKAFLYRSVRNRSLNHLRDHATETVGLDSVSSLHSNHGNDGSEIEEEPDPTIEMVKKWIEELPDRQREAFKLSRYEGLDHEEIAGVMELSSNTVNNHIVAALDNLRLRHDAYQKKKVNNT